jgi:hypothetical protein
MPESKAKSYNCWYYSDTNEVGITDYDGTTEEPDYFVTVTDETMKICNEAGETLELKPSRQTVGQGVILFASMLGLRDAAFPW